MVSRKTNERNVLPLIIRSKRSIATLHNERYLKPRFEREDNNGKLQKHKHA